MVILGATVSKYQQSLSLLRKYYGEEHVATRWGYVLLGDVRAEMGDLSRSLAEMKQGLGILSRALNGQDLRYLSARVAYARVLDKAGNRAEAASIKTDKERRVKMFYSDQCIGCTISAKAFR